MSLPSRLRCCLRRDRPATSRLSIMSRCGPGTIRGRGSVRIGQRLAPRAVGGRTNGSAGRRRDFLMRQQPTCRTNQPRAACFKRPAFFFGPARMRRLTLPQCRSEIATCQRSGNCLLPLFFTGETGYHSRLTRMWRNWQTRKIQVLVAARSWRFKSSRPHLFDLGDDCHPVAS